MTTPLLGYSVPETLTNDDGKAQKGKTLAVTGPNGYGGVTVSDSATGIFRLGPLPIGVYTVTYGERSAEVPVFPTAVDLQAAYDASAAAATSTALTAEAAARASADSAEQSARAAAVTAEAASRAAADTAEAATRASAVAAEAATRAAADGTDDTDDAAEVTARQAAVTAEASARAAADTAESAARSAADTAEAAARAALDAREAADNAARATAIGDEATARSAAVAAETAARIAADSALQTSVTANTSALTLKAPLASPAFTGTPTLGGSPLLTQAAAAGAYPTAEVIAFGTGIDPTGTADSTTALQAKINAVPAGGRLFIPTGRYKLSAALTVATNMTIEGGSACATFPSNNDGTTPTGLTGTVLVQTATATDGLKITGSAVTVHLRNIGVLFQAGLASTGHGINASPTEVVGSGHAIGLNDFRWDNVLVYGHDGDHYGAVLLNPLLGTVSHFRAYLGGGVKTVCDVGAINAGNITWLAPYNELSNAGAAGGFVHSAAVTGGVPGVLNLITYIRPQVIMGGAAKTAATQYMWDDLAGAGIPAQINVVGMDLESSGNPVRFGSGTQILGNTLISGSATYPSNHSIAVYGDAAMPNPSAGNNSAFGAQALGTSGSTGTNNTAVGFQSSKANTSGASNTAVGSLALTAVTTASNNTAVGVSALSGGNQSNNTGFGYKALLLGGGGGQDTAVGYQSFIGLNAGTGKNTALGAGAGNNAVGTDGGTFIGYLAGQVTTGNLSRGTAVGYNSAVQGNYSTALGANTVCNAAGGVALGTDNAGTGATTTTANTIALGTALHSLLLAGGGAGLGGGVGVVSVKNAGTAPSTNPTGGGILYAAAGALVWRGSSGTVTTIAPA